MSRLTIIASDGSVLFDFDRINNTLLMPTAPPQRAAAFVMLVSAMSQLCDVQAEAITASANLTRAATPPAPAAPPAPKRADLRLVE